MNTIWISTAAAAVLGVAAACTNHAQDLADYRAMCLTRTDVLHHSERSRTGLSARCDETLRARNAVR